MSFSVKSQPLRSKRFSATIHLNHKFYSFNFNSNNTPLIFLNTSSIIRSIEPSIFSKNDSLITQPDETIRKDLDSIVDSWLSLSSPLNPLANNFIPANISPNSHPPTSPVTTLPAYSPSLSPISEFNLTSPCNTKQSLQGKLLSFSLFLHDEMASLN
ncbi:hypothetical protein O181_061457 [Austropuccinia psidii MF-1]|uniref:Uncharacterized protein n=1 Tax=Austropuccinia psidii MF-1 TaxID=1389203 RepID=A0A9Q3HZD8_9BASI|nr:hypothetical protein [Austropuccinia psidii MF-1]